MANKYSAIDAAAKILRSKRRSTRVVGMTTNELVAEAARLGYWEGSGKTPAQSLYGAIHREIKRKGEKSRFRKTGKNRFAFNHPAA